MLCNSSAGSTEPSLVIVGLLREANIVAIVIRPAASTIARSQPVGLHAKCFNGPPSSVDVMFEGIVGSLRDHDPLSG